MKEVLGYIFKAYFSLDIPKVLIKDNQYEFAKPAIKIFNRIVRTADWPKQWRQEYITVIPKPKTDPPQTEDDLRNFAKTSWMSKLCEAPLGGPIPGPRAVWWIPWNFCYSLPGEAV